MILKSLLSIIPIVLPVSVNSYEVATNTIENKNMYSGPNLKTKSIRVNKMISKSYIKKGTYTQNLAFTVDLKKELKITDQEIYTSKFTFVFNNKHWNQSSDSKGWQNPSTFKMEITYIDWLIEGSVFAFSNPELIRKAKNYINSTQNNEMDLDFDNNIMYIDLTTEITSHVVSGGWESGNNHGWTKTGLTSIDVKYIGW